MEEKDFDMLIHESGDGSGSNQFASTTDDVHLPVFLAYLSLGYKIVTTLIVVLMAGWVIITIRNTRSLHNIHNIFIAHLMATDATTALISLMFTSTMMIGYFTGMGDFIGCHVFRFFLFPVTVVYFTFVTISVDKVIAITFPLRYHEIMKPRVVLAIISIKWVVAVVLSIHNLFNPGGFSKGGQFGTCKSNSTGVVSSLMANVLPIFFSCLLTVILNIYLTIKAYQIHKKIQEESKLSGGHSRDNDRLKALKKKEAIIKKHRKPMITLLVVVLGSTSIGLLFPLLFLLTVFLESGILYKEFMHHVIGSNLGFTSLLFHPFVYGLYFKQVREPMMRLLKRITCPCKCKSAAVAPQPQRNRINWLNPN